MLRRLLSLLVLVLTIFSASAQYMMEADQPDFYSFSKPSVQKLTTEATDLIPTDYRNHPEYAKNPYNAPCENCTELIDRRKIDERYFVENGTDGTMFYLQQSYSPLHIRDNLGNLVSLDPRLTSQSPGIFTAENQHFPVKIDAINHFASIKNSGYEFKFNTALELLHKDTEGNITSLGEANWTSYSAGDDGIRVFNVWPKIDMEIRALEGKVKTNFIIKEKVIPGNGFLIVKDILNFPDDLKPYNYSGELTEGYLFDEDLSFKDGQGKEQYTIGRAFAFDSHAENARATYYLNYEWKKNHELMIHVPLQWLNDEERTYPVTIDPPVSAIGTLPMASITGSGDGTGFANGCPYSLNVTVPANCTVTDVRWSFNYTALSGCFAGDGAVDFSLGACRSPGAAGYYWRCTTPTNPPPLNTPIPNTACNGNNISAMNDPPPPAGPGGSALGPCIPPPQCAPYTLTFGMKFYRSNPFGGNTCNNLCIAAGSNWTMTVIGRTVEIPTISPNQTICAGNSATITASGSYGVPPYTYAWSNGATGSTISVTPATNTTYTATITDACGQTATANSIVNVTQNTNPGFTINPNPVCAGQPVTVTGLGSGPVGSYDWLLPGSTLTPVNNTQSPSVTYNTSGTYNITLNYQQGTCTFPLSQQVTVSPSGGTPSVSVAANPAGAICAGTSVTFTATPTNGGGAPTYQWQVNGVNAGSGGATFTSSSLNNGDVVTVILTSNAACVSPPTATSTAIVMNVSSTLVPSVSIAANPAGAICAGASVTFTATPTNGGGAPTYQWKVNGTNAGSGGATFTSTTLSNGDVVSVVMTSNAGCVSTTTATSNNINMTVNPSITPSVTIAANPSTAVCPGINITFTPTPTNGGAGPTYQWQVNGTNAGTGATFSSTSLNNGDVVHAILTSNANCVVPATATSSDLAVAITPAPVPSVSITANPSGPVCAGTNMTFTPTPVNGGSTPTYQWQVNGTNAGTGATFSSSSLNNNDDVTVILTSNATCASPATATSNTITIAVSTNLMPAVTIAANPSGIICAGTSVTFTPTPTNGGSAPTYQWQVNGTNSGTGATFTSSTLNNADVVSAIMTSNATCVSTTTANSNNISMLVLPILPPSVTIVANPSGGICAGASVTFTASPTNGGTPTYQWQVNGTNAGTGTATFTSTALNNGDNVTVIMTSNAACISPTTATSNQITMSVTPTVTPSVTVAAVPSGQICSGTSVTFTASPSNGGASPTYQWQVNGTNAGTGATFTSASLNDADEVVVIMTSDDACPLPATASSTPLVMSVSTTLTPTVTIDVVPVGTICNGTTVLFTPVTSGGGNNPTFQWTLNGANAGTNPTFSSSTLNDNDVIEVVMTSSSSCANPQTATSPQITMDVNEVVPSVTIVDSPTGPQCAGTSISLTATPVNGGNNPSYDWLVNGVSSGSSGAVFTSTTFNDGDVVSVVLTSDAACANPANTTSNQIIIVLTQPITVTVSNDTTICSNLPVLLNAQATGGDGIYSYTWNNNAGNGSNVSVNPSQTTTYQVTVNDQCGSTSGADSVVVTVNNPSAEFSFSLQILSADDPEVTFDNESQGGTGYLWDFGDGNTSTEESPVHLYGPPGDYLVTLTVTSAGGCVETTSYTVSIEDVIAFWIPSAFTPNGDGLNDTFGMIGTMDNPYIMRVYNRQGSEIYFTDNSAQWNGAIFNVGDVVPNGVYVYEIDLNDSDFKGKTFVGRVTLIRDGR